VAALELAGRPNGAVPARVALLHDYESAWVYDAQPHSAGASYWRQVMLFYGALRGLGVDVDVRHPDHDLTGYAVVVAPALQMVGAERAAHLTATAAGAALVVGPRTAYRTPTGMVHDDGQPGPLRELLGCTLRNFDGLRPGLTVRVGEHVVETWAEGYGLVGGEATHRYADGPLAGEAAVVRHGNATTIGAWSAGVVGEVLAGVLAERGVPTTPLPEGVRLARRGGSVTAMNFNEAPATLRDGTTLGAVSFEVER
jgi:beta-galactosidase